ncbi:hypothetical protein IEN85_02090 [Pelagicoccus sp. NFK12]|uniref:Uncharacterized protein n=1 Tax=Pelagicoccus enzymogenes TaxID=2773457 RepID=A0A927F510_9BACT|nr:hypothetical protein [Pelagicoccus enzymogenes]MBD5778282.1 hypothetical protein [Pelagicoccus enzymogenes]
MKYDEDGGGVSFARRLMGAVGGAVAGLVVSAILFFILAVELEIISDDDGQFTLVVRVGVVVGLILGVLFPRVFLRIGSAFGKLIPGF